MSEELQVEKIIEKMSLKNLTPEIDLAISTAFSME